MRGEHRRHLHADRPTDRPTDRLASYYFNVSALLANPYPSPTLTEPGGAVEVKQALPRNGIPSDSLIGRRGSNCGQWERRAADLDHRCPELSSEKRRRESGILTPSETSYMRKLSASERE
ncbi:hypothetical protein F2P81_018176 [Scophthalmus maximus]|uniref:Uncharacterized protein n=1 Tax=Scophthalmus maximus TaxID=52904 RepID=A0A6A4SD91_SCOMX|nr:hypothetical protein F2P81_018176 [Scophthalmus maximus]